MVIRSRLRIASLLVLLVSACASPPDGSPPCAGAPAPVSITAAEEEVRPMGAEGPEALARLLLEYDAASGAERARLAERVDRVAGQRYATSSRLYWHTELADAQATARASGKPILSLRMLGRLDEDRSCANSRLFRVALYANAELARWLDDSFVLHWSSERAVPRLTIDYGDGRRIETTIAGNSAHYVLDADGRVLDVVPGLMTPQAFRGELEGALALAARLAAETPDAHTRARMIAAHHRAKAEATRAEWGILADAGVPSPTPTIAMAERVTISKMQIERPAVAMAKLGRDPATIDAASELWPAIGERLLAGRGLATGGDAVLDRRSRELVAALRPIDWSTTAPLDDAGLARLSGALTRSLVADTGLNLARLRPQIHAELARRAETDDALDFTAVNAWLYATLFLTPADDRWLGLATPDVFTGLPGDGLTIAG